jgi:hypothetical protein
VSDSEHEVEKRTVRASTYGDVAPLDYAAGTTECGITYRRDPEGAVIVIPSPRRRRSEAASYVTIAVFVNELGLLLAAGAVLAWLAKERWVCPALGALVAVTYGIAWWWHRRLGEPMVVEVTPKVVVFENFSRETPVHTVPRDQIYDVKYVSHSGNLVIRARGHEILEWRPVENERELARIALFLREAIGMDKGPQRPAPASPGSP